jgi:glycosyltransferase involved in cell wall biosynthesis
MTEAARHRQDLENAIMVSRPDICYIRSLNEFKWAIPYCKQNNIPVIPVCCARRDVLPFSYWFNPRKFLVDLSSLRQYRRLVNFRSIRLSDEIVCITNTLRNYLKFWYPNKSIRVIYNGHPIPSEADVHRAYEKRVIWVNNIKRIKRPELYIKLASYLPDVEFVMIGWLGQHGRYNGYIRSLIKNGPANLKYLGAFPVDQVNQEICSSDILFYTSTRGEGFGNSFIQAWMRGVPTIALESDPDGIIERERIGHCSHNFSQLVEHTRELIDNPLLLREMGQRAREYAVVNHDREHMVSRYEALFRELYERKSASLPHLVRRVDVVK